MNDMKDTSSQPEREPDTTRLDAARLRRLRNLDRNGALYALAFLAARDPAAADQALDAWDAKMAKDHATNEGGTHSFGDGCPDAQVRP
jgi:hypothetical protein